MQFWDFSVLQRHGVSPPGGDFYYYYYDYDYDYDDDYDYYYYYVRPFGFLCLLRILPDSLVVWIQVPHVGHAWT